MHRKKQKYLLTIEDPLQSYKELYDPFSPSAHYSLSQPQPNRVYNSSKTLFEQCETGSNITSMQIHSAQNAVVETSKPSQPKQSNIERVIAANNNPRTKSQQCGCDKKDYGFNNDNENCDNFRAPYPQTPGFKVHLRSPFYKFNQQLKATIDSLCRERDADARIGSIEKVDIQASPLLFYNADKLYFNSAHFFIGISLTLKEKNCQAQSLFFSCLACYADPYSSQTWKKYISQIEEQGKLGKASALAKTGFLFTQNEELAKLFISLGERCGMELRKIQGLMCSVSNLEVFEKNLLPESCRLEMKYGKPWKGVRVLWEICKNNDLKLSVCINTLFLSRYLENMGMMEAALNLLRKSFSPYMTKMEIYLQYFHMSMRLKNGLDQADLQEVLNYCDYIAGENQYKFFLQIAEVLFKNNDQRFYQQIKKSYRSAMTYCVAGAGRNRALKQIYYKIAQLKQIAPQLKSTLSDNEVFEINRRRFVNKQPLLEHKFEDWKFYLHYGCIRRHDLLADAALKWPQTGRLIAEWIHCLRLSKPPLVMLKIWRDKIDEVPKSGELWCEGGRIYMELGELKNAEKCFRCAMHFTPQYGDSFFEVLSILLKEGRMLEVQKLRRLFLVSQPFYGHVLSYLQLNHWKKFGLNLSEVWSSAVYTISQGLYTADSSDNRLTAYSAYNYAYRHKQSAMQRQILFCSYQQMQNKN